MIAIRLWTDLEKNVVVKTLKAKVKFSPSFDIEAEALTKHTHALICSVTSVYFALHLRGPRCVLN